jgi:NTP pyrophosphatase (non-canonical NTP hydrolase)
MSLTFRELQDACEARTPCFPETANNWSFLERAGALCGEAGELANFAKKHRRDGLECEQEMAKELADIVTYATIFATRLGVDIGEAVRDKFNEVSQRRDEINRAEDNGRPVAPRL